jgi:hypothetical protein
LKLFRQMNNNLKKLLLLLISQINDILLV